MKMARLALVLVGLAAPLPAAGQSPVQKVLQLLTDLAAKVAADGERSKALYTEFAAWCEDRAANVNFEIKTGESQVAGLEATIAEETALISSLSLKVEELGASIATNEADLKAATEIRAKEAADFAAEQSDLTEVVNTLRRAIAILEREMRQGGATMVQLQAATSLSQALGIMVQSAAISTADASRLTALVQNSQQSEDGDLNLGAPSVAAYESHSRGVLQTLTDLLDQAESQLQAARKRETTDLHSFELLRQSLEDEIKFSTKELNEAKQGIAASGQKKAAAEGDLDITSKDLAGDKQTLGSLQHDCATKSQDYESEVKSREEELKALAEAKKVIADNTSPAAEISYGLSQVSLLQVGRVSLSSGTDLAHFEAVRFVRDLAKKLGAPALAQLAAHMAAATQFGAGSSDPFAKVKGLISDMIKRLEADAGADASHKAYCDRETADATSSKEYKSGKIEKLSTRIDQMSARSAQLKEEIAALQSALASLAKSQAEMDKQRQSEHDLFLTEKANLEQGLQGIKLALKVLRDYYGKADKAHASGEEAATGVIALIEVVESDFSKGLAGTIAAEESAQLAYTEDTKANEIEKTTKLQDVKFKSGESLSLDKAVADATSDRASEQRALDAVLDYLHKLEEQCVAKAEPYAERAARRAAEIAGLRQALEILQGEAVLLQQARRVLRGVRPHVAA